MHDMQELNSSPGMIAANTRAHSGHKLSPAWQIARASGNDNAICKSCQLPRRRYIHIHMYMCASERVNVIKCRCSLADSTAPIVDLACAFFARDISLESDGGGWLVVVRS
jgi:hypothetical protein